MTPAAVPTPQPPLQPVPPAGASPWADDRRAAEIVAAMRARNPKACPLERLPDVHPGKIPRHIAFILDGNGRWAAQRGLSRVYGHHNGAAAVRQVIEECGRLGVEVITLYSFSLENWKRPKEEIDALMFLYELYLEGEREALARENVRFVQIGRREGMPASVLEKVAQVERETAGNTAATLCLAVNYGSRAELVDAARALAGDVASGKIRPQDIDEAALAGRLYTAGLPDPDLMIRTAGELRLSNYLLWQLSYAELWVTPTLWPDFGVAQLHEAVRDYARRERRFGGLPSPEGASA